LKQQFKNTLRRLGYEIHRVSPHGQESQKTRLPSVTVNPIWPLPRDKNGQSEQQIREEFAKYQNWHYAYEFEGGPSFSLCYKEGQPKEGDPLVFDSRRALQRFHHFMPYVVESQKGSLQGKRVLDIACNSGFWSMQCALLGAQVVGFDARPELIEQANLIKRIVGASNVEFKVLDFWDMSPQLLGGTFDVVLSLGILYHLPRPVEALRLSKLMSRDYILLDTEVYPSPDSVVQLRWEEPGSVRSAVRSGIVEAPSKSGIEMILKEIGAAESFEIPLRTSDMPPDYRDQRRASWLVKV